ncbi:MAG: acyl-CoA thioesterase [Candidatus Hodarchaeales archaeon]
MTLREVFEKTLGKIHYNNAAVRMADLDSLGVVHSNVYVIFFEDGFLSFMKDVEIPCSGLDKKGITFPVVSVLCDYRRPAFFEDDLIIATSVSELGKTSFVCNHKVFRKVEEKKILCAEGKMVRVVMKDLKLINLSDVLV